jgi:hypothetical protein
LSDDVQDDSTEPDALLRLGLASVSGQTALGAPPGKVGRALGKRKRDPRAVPHVKPLCVEAEGFTLHAATRIPRHERGDLEVLCRYILRPPIATERVRLRPDGLVELTLPRPWSDGTTALTFEPLAFMGRLVPLIPRPYSHETRYHGVLSPHAKDRNEVIASAVKAGGLRRDDEPKRKSTCPRERRLIASAVKAGGLRRDDEPKRNSTCPRERRLEWAELLRRTWAVDVLRCSRCGGRRTLLAFVRDPKAIRAILGHLGLLLDQPAPPRGPPQQELDLP